MRHFRGFPDISPDECQYLLHLTTQLKQNSAEGRLPPRLHRPLLGLFFEKPSLRTRVSFEAAIAHLGGSAVFLSSNDVGLGQRESVADFARVISRYVDLLAVRVFHQTLVDELARTATCPVINALSDEAHPCQALADVFTVLERRGRLRGRRLTFVGDGNNVARSLAHACLYCGMEFVLSSPAGYEFTPNFVASLQAGGYTGRFHQEPDPIKAVTGTDVVYTDVWASMGQEAEQAIRKQVFVPYQVNDHLMSHAKPDALFLHCLPAHRGEEVTDSVMEGTHSAVFDQAENRLHAQKALMVWLLKQSQ